MPPDLLEICKRVVRDPKYQPEDVDKDGDLDTKCNFAVWDICAEMGYSKFKDLKLVANQIFEHLITLPEWSLVDGLRAQIQANQNKLAIAAQRGDPHGHVAVVAPGDMEMVKSAKWNKKVPLVANVGPKQRMGIMGSNFAFGSEPNYFILIP